MKYLLTLILVFLPSLSLAQSAITAAIQERFDLKPRLERGDSQRYLLEIDYLTLDTTGVAARLLRSECFLTLLCLENSPDKIRYEVIMDSLANGSPVTQTGEIRSRSWLKGFEGYSFHYELGKEIPLTGECFDPSSIVDESHSFGAAQQFMDQFTLIWLMDQFRFMAGRRLSALGDTTYFAMPGPICYQIPGLVKDCTIHQEPYNLRVLGISKYGNEPCVLVEVGQRPAPLSITYLTRDGGEREASGTRNLSGRFTVALRNGALLATDLQQRLDGRLETDDGLAQNNVYIYTRLRAIN